MADSLLSPDKLLDIIRSTVVVPASASSVDAARSSEAAASSGTSTGDAAGQGSSSASQADSAVVLRNSTALIALLVHAIHTSLGFRQVRPVSPPPPSSNEDNNATIQDPSQQQQRNKINQDWYEAKSDEESFSFDYRHEQSALLFQIRIARLGGRTVINAVAVEVCLFSDVYLSQLLKTYADTFLLLCSPVHTP